MTLAKGERILHHLARRIGLDNHGHAPPQRPRQSFCMAVPAIFHITAGLFGTSSTKSWTTLFSIIRFASKFEEYSANAMALRQLRGYLETLSKLLDNLFNPFVVHHFEWRIERYRCVDL